MATTSKTKTITIAMAIVRRVIPLEGALMERSKEDKSGNFTGYNKRSPRSILCPNLFTF